MKVVTTEECCKYFSPFHPESPERVKKTIEFLKLKKEIEFIKPKLCEEEELFYVHAKELVKRVKGNDFYDPDTPALPNIYHYALLSAGGAVLSMELALRGESVFSLMRPPGHHATRVSVGGFCYFNNIAIAVGKFLSKNQNKKAAILDIDCHHGNGTEDIFLGKEGVIYVSLHQSPLYPGTGLKSVKNCFNFPYPPGVREKEYIDLLERSLELIQDFKPDLLAVSAGFDTYHADPLTQTKLDRDSYKRIGEMIRNLGLKRFAILEGGYSEDLPFLIYNFLLGFC